MNRNASAALLAALAVSVASALLGPGEASASFESPPVHPVEISPDGTRLFVVHTVDHRLVVFDISGAGPPVRIAEIPVGIEPVTVRARTNDEVWVVNHVSDDVSIVNVPQGNVVKTILCGDEPTDVVFAGVPERAFVCVSQENRIRVYDPSNLDLPAVDVDLPASDPRSLAVSPDGATVYVTALEGGNATTVVSFHAVDEAGGLPPPSIPMDPELPAAPVTGLIVKHDGAHWRDETGADWDSVATYLPLDHDVLAVDAATAAVTATYSGVGTTQFNVAVNPMNGKLVVTNQDATNEIRFEPVLNGQFLRNRVTLIDPVSGVTTPVHLNPHIDYGSNGNGQERARSLSIPLDVVVRGDGLRMYVAAFGSEKVAELDASGNVIRRLDVGDGPCGLALDAAGNRLYVMNRNKSTISVVSLSIGSSYEVPLGFDPTPANVISGRSQFYSGRMSSGHGDISCASCHVFAHLDNLAWDLGDPGGAFLDPPTPAPGDSLGGFHPMKGPMVTQTLKGLSGTEPFHWRGDRPELVEFNPAFVGLLGRNNELTASKFQDMEDFLLSLRLPPNPNRKLGGGLRNSVAGGDPQAGEDIFFTLIVDGGGSCFTCHENPTGNSSRVVPTALVQAISNQEMTVPQLRTMYEKTGFEPDSATTVRTIGSSHSGFAGSVFPHQLTLGQKDRRARSRAPLPGLAPDGFGFPSFPPDPDVSDVEAFMLSFDTGTHPVVGAQWTMDGTNEAAGISRLNTMVSVADGGEAGLIAKGRDLAGDARGWMYAGGGSWIPDRQVEPATSLTALLTLAGPGTEITFTGVLPGEELRLGVDRDLDGFRDRDELDLGSDPGDPNSTPATGAPELAASGPDLRLLGRNPARADSRIAFTVRREGPAELRVYDVAGRVVRTLVREPVHEPGEFEALWDLRDARGSRVGSGVYFVRLSELGGTVTGRLTVLR